MIPRSRRNLLFASEREGFVFGNTDMWGHAQKRRGGERSHRGWRCEEGWQGGEGRKDAGGATTPLEIPGS